MKHLFQIIFFLLCATVAQGQTTVSSEQGTVTFTSSRNVYVKFASTEKIEIGDTLYHKQVEELVPSLVVNNKSSSSVVCTILGNKVWKKEDKVFARIVIKELEEEIDVTNDPFVGTNPTTATEEAVAPALQPEEDARAVSLKQKIKGRVSVASYNNMSSFRNNHRMRYGFRFRGQNLNNSKFSVDNYITFRQTLGEPIDSLSEALKIYSLSVKYDIDPNSSITFGRKINPKISSMGAIDGLQFEKGFGNVYIGAIAGTRPDFADYSINLNLFQAGAYVGFKPKDPTKYGQTTLGFIEQRNKAQVDRRLIYFQHSGELAKNLSLFGSFEVDLFENLDGVARSKTDLTNLYVSLRYRFNRKVRISASYDTRKNIIYYESYKHFVDQLIDNETRQGLRFGLSVRPSKFISVGVNSSLRFQKSGANDARNLSAYVTMSKLPGVNARLSLRANLLQTSYINSRIFGARLSKPLIKRKVNAEIYYRWVDYQYKNSETTIHQNIAGASLSIRVLKKLSLNLYYEGVFDNRNQQYQRFNVKVIQRF